MFKNIKLVFNTNFIIIDNIFDYLCKINTHLTKFIIYEKTHILGNHCHFFVTIDANGGRNIHKGHGRT